MSARETAVNTLLGLLLLLAIAIPCAAFVAAYGLTLYGIDLAVKHFFPALNHTRDVELYGLFCLVGLLWSVRHLRRRLWPNAFLSLATVAAFASIGLAELHSGYGQDELFSNVWPLFLLFMVLREERLQRWEFLLGAIFVSLGVAAATGMLGRTTLAVYVRSGVVLGVFAWFFVSVRRGILPGPDTSAASTRP